MYVAEAFVASFFFVLYISGSQTNPQGQMVHNFVYPCVVCENVVCLALRTGLSTSAQAPVSLTGPWCMNNSVGIKWLFGLVSFWKMEVCEEKEFSRAGTQ